MCCSGFTGVCFLSAHLLSDGVGQTGLGAAVGLHIKITRDCLSKILYICFEYTNNHPYYIITTLINLLVNSFLVDT